MGKSEDLMKKIKNAPDRIEKGMSNSDLYRVNMKYLMAKGDKFKVAEMKTSMYMLRKIGRQKLARVLASVSPRFADDYFFDAIQRALEFTDLVKAQHKAVGVFNAPDVVTSDMPLADKYISLVKSYYRTSEDKSVFDAEFNVIVDMLADENFDKKNEPLLYKTLCEESPYMTYLNDDDRRLSFFNNCKEAALMKPIKETDSRWIYKNSVFKTFCSECEEARLKGHDMSESYKQGILSLEFSDRETADMLAEKFGFKDKADADNYIEYIKYHSDRTSYVDNRNNSVEKLDATDIIKDFPYFDDKFSYLDGKAYHSSDEDFVNSPSFKKMKEKFIEELGEFCKDVKFRCGYDFKVSRAADDLYFGMSKFKYGQHPFSYKITHIEEVMEKFKDAVYDFADRDLKSRVDKVKKLREQSIVEFEGKIDSKSSFLKRFVFLTNSNLKNDMDMHQALMASALEFVKSGVSRGILEDILFKVSPECISRKNAKAVTDKVFDYYNRSKAPVSNNRRSIDKAKSIESQGNENR